MEIHCNGPGTQTQAEEKLTENAAKLGEILYAEVTRIQKKYPDHLTWAYAKGLVGGIRCTTKDKQPDPETAKKFLSAAKKGYEDAIKDPEGAAKILCEAAPELDKDLVVNSQKYMKDQYKAEVDQWGYIDPERWNAFYNWLNEKKLVETQIPENTGFTNDYLE